MVKLPFEFCPVAMEVRAALDERRLRDAKRIAAKHLRVGCKSQQFLDVVAEMLETKKEKGKRGRKKQATYNPPYWYEIGTAFDDLVLPKDDKPGLSYVKAIEELAEGPGRLGPKKNAIQKAVAFYRKAKKQHDEACWGPKTPSF
jgi:hypothetical protein